MTIFISSAEIDCLYKGERIAYDAPENVFTTAQSNTAPNHHALCHIAEGNLHLIKAESAVGISPKNREQHYALHALLDPSIPCIALSGPAGCGKTLLAIAAAIEQRRDYLQILVARPPVELGPRMGALPGDAGEKMHPYLAPLRDNLSIIKRAGQKELVEKLQEDKKIEMEHIAYIQGRSLFRRFLIVDEAQNLKPNEIKTVITRAGEGTKVVLCGDPGQVNRQELNEDNNGLSHTINRLAGERLFAHIELIKCERSPLATLAALKL